MSERHTYWWHLRNTIRDDWAHGSLRHDLALLAGLVAAGLIVWWAGAR
jgi:hypothetical protein